MRPAAAAVVILITAFAFECSAANVSTLRYGDSPYPIVAHADYMENEIDVRTVSDGSGAETVRKTENDEVRRSMEIRKVVDVKTLKDSFPAELSRSFYLMDEKSTILSADGEGLGSNEGRKVRIATKIDELGHTQTPTSLADLPFTSFPIILPPKEAKEGDEWSGTMRLMTVEGSEVDVMATYSLQKIESSYGVRRAEIDYVLSGEVVATDVTDDPASYARLEKMRSRGVERIAITGNGKVSFDIGRRLPAVHVTDLIVEVAVKSIKEMKMVRDEKMLEMHKAEALLLL